MSILMGFLPSLVRVFGSLNEDLALIITKVLFAYFYSLDGGSRRIWEVLDLSESNGFCGTKGTLKIRREE